MTRLPLALILAGLVAGTTLAPSGAHAEGYSGTITGQNGGTVTFTGDCARSEGGVACSRDSKLTGPEGKTATRKLERFFTRDRVSTRATTTGENGRSVTKTREWSR